MPNEVLTRLRTRLTGATAERDRIKRSRSAIWEIAKQEGREDLNEAEDTEYKELTASLTAADEEITKLQERVTELDEEEIRNEKVASAAKRLALAETEHHSITVREGRIYDRASGNSYFRDLMRTQMFGDDNARARLQRHAQDVATEVEYRDITRVDGAGGYFVPPAWLVNQAVELARAGRPTANLVTNEPLPPGTDSINIPKVSTGTATAIQTTDNAAVQETDLVDTVVTAGVKTIAGQQDVAIQLLDQSPVAFDAIIFRDLMADYATKTDLQVLLGSNASGQVQGLFGTSGINTVAYTTASPTVALLYPKVADAVQRIHTARFLPPTVIVMHPRRWGYLLAAVDTAGRPLVVPNQNGPFNAIGVNEATASQQVVGSMMGLPVVTDPSIPTTWSAGAPGAGTEDAIIIMRASDLVLWESGLRSRVLPDVGSGALTVRLQVYGYIAFTAARYPAAVSVIAGTGMVAPTF